MIPNFDRLEDAFIADEYDVTFLYGGRINEDEVVDKLENNDVARYLISAPSNPNDELTRETGAAYSNDMAYMLSFANTPREAVQANEDWLIKMGYVTENGVVGLPPVAPYVYSTVTILRWWPVGLIENYATDFANKYVVEQYIRISLLRE